MSPFVSETMLRFSLERLAQWHATVSAQSVRHVFSLLPVKLALQGASSIGYEERDDQTFLDSFFAIPGANAGEPYFDPFSQSWLKASYAHSNAATFRKRTFNLSWGAGAWQDNVISLASNYAEIFARRALTKGGYTSRIPAIPTAIWFFCMSARSEDPPAGLGQLPMDGELLVSQLRSWMGFTEADWDLVFETTASDRTAFESLARDPAEGPLSDDEIRAICHEFERAAASIEGIRTTLTRDNAERAEPATTIEELAARLFLPIEAVEDMLWVLREKRTLVLTGPPGVGKTFIARELAAFVAAQNVDFVQFHPSLSYEYFVSGYRPVTDGDSGLRYELAGGPLLRSLDKAKAVQSDSPGHSQVLIIDEINRANVSAVFGEFMSAMEYRGSAVHLQYGNPYDERGLMEVPENFLLIATMNNADRSVGSFDAALRRRFGFYECNPLEFPFQEVLRSYLTARFPDGGHEWIADWVDDLNANLPDPDFAIGGSYFFGRDDLSKDEVRRLVEYQIKPFLRGKFGKEGMARLADWIDIDPIVVEVSQTTFVQPATGLR